VDGVISSSKIYGTSAEVNELEEEDKELSVSLLDFCSLRSLCFSIPF